MKVRIALAKVVDISFLPEHLHDEALVEKVEGMLAWDSEEVPEGKLDWYELISEEPEEFDIKIMR